MRKVQSSADNSAIAQYFYNLFNASMIGRHMKIVVDFDGTCVKNRFPFIGDDIGAAPVLKKWEEQGHHIILSTMRSGVFLSQAIKWFNDNGIKLYGIQKDPTQRFWTSSPKAFGHVYIDDSALGCPLIYEDGKPPYVDWVMVDKLFEEYVGRINNREA